MNRDTRDFIGYGEFPPNAQWPNKARLAVSFVLNYEEGAEACLLDGDEGSETLLCDLVGVPSNSGGRNISVESLYEYGSRAGFWRIKRLFTERGLPLTVYACGKALERNPEAAKAMMDADWEIATHGYRWLDYSHPKTVEAVNIEADHINRAIQIQESICGYKPFGFYQGKPSPYTRQLAMDAGVLYDSDTYADDLPYWSPHFKRTNGEREGESPLLLIPYTLSNNDMKFVTVNGFANGEQFFSFLKDTFDFLYKEGSTTPKMMTIVLFMYIDDISAHATHLVGHPGRAQQLAKFLDYISGYEDIWICRRIDIALHWYRFHYPSNNEALNGTPLSDETSNSTGVKTEPECVKTGDQPEEWRKRLGSVGPKPIWLDKIGATVERLECCSMEEIVKFAKGQNN